MIVTDEEALRIKCEPVLPEEVDDLRAKLEEALAESSVPGVGLACPQIGIGKAMAIIRPRTKTGIDTAHSIDLVNAKIIESYHQYEFDGEGCLSFPDRFETTLRYKEILVENNLGPPSRFIATDFLAVIIQHELDHLKGVLLSDVALP